MSGSVEERLRQALRQQAETTTTSSDAWVRIRAGSDGRPRRTRWALLAPAGLAVLLVVALLALTDRTGDRTLRVTGADRLYLVPTGVEPRFHPVEVGPGPVTSPLPPWTFRVFGRRAPDGVALAASVVITVPADRALRGATPDLVPLRVLGRDVAVAGDDFWQKILSWTQSDGRTVGVMTFGLSQAELVTLAESLLLGDAAADAPVLPAGFALVGRGAPSGEAPSLTMQTWEADDGDRFMLTVYEPNDVGEPAWWVPGGRATKVRATTAIYRALAGDDALLAWTERPGTSVVLQARGLTERELVAVADGLRAVDEPEWRRLSARAGRPQVGPPAAGSEVPQIGPPPGVVPQPDSYFGLLPVKGQSPPPCGAGPGIVLPERRGGREVACYQVTRPLVDAGDVATADVIHDGTSGTWEVRFTLTVEGARRLRALYDEVGPGGQFVVLVDGQIVAAPRFASAPPGDTGVVTGLEEPAARSLADRLRQ